MVGRDTAQQREFPDVRVFQLVELEARRPDQAHIQAYAQWKQQIEGVRLQMRKQSTDVLKNARLAAMTTTRAVFSLADLRALSSYNLIVFDEASQVELAHALALVVIILSPGDRHNPLLDQIANVIENSSLAHTAIPICNLVLHPEFPDCALGMVIQIRNDMGRLVAIDGTGNRFTVIDFRTGEKRKYITSAMLGVVLKEKAQEVLAGRAYWSGQERSAARRLVGDEQHQCGDLRLARRLLALA